MRLKIRKVKMLIVNCVRLCFGVIVFYFVTLLSKSCVMKKVFILFLICVSCSTLNQFNGKHIDTVIDRYGYPVSQRELTNGTAFYYNYTEDNPTTMYSRNGYTIINEANTVRYWLVFYCDRRGIIYDRQKIRKN